MRDVEATKRRVLANSPVRLVLAFRKIARLLADPEYSRHVGIAQVNLALRQMTIYWSVIDSRVIEGWATIRPELWLQSSVMSNASSQSQPVTAGTGTLLTRAGRPTAAFRRRTRSPSSLRLDR